MHLSFGLFLFSELVLVASAASTHSSISLEFTLLQTGSFVVNFLLFLMNFFKFFAVFFDILDEIGHYVVAFLFATHISTDKLLEIALHVDSAALWRILMGLVSFVLIDLTIALAIFGFAVESVGFIWMKGRILMELLFGLGVIDFVFGVVGVEIGLIFFFGLGFEVASGGLSHHFIMVVLVIII